MKKPFWTLLECYLHCDFNEDCQLVQISVVDSFCGLIHKNRGHQGRRAYYDPNYLVFQKNIDRSFILKGIFRYNLDAYRVGKTSRGIHSTVSHVILYYEKILDIAAGLLVDSRSSQMRLTLKQKTSFNDAGNACSRTMCDFMNVKWLDLANFGDFMSIRTKPEGGITCKS